MPEGGDGRRVGPTAGRGRRGSAGRRFAAAFVRQRLARQHPYSASRKGRRQARGRGRCRFDADRMSRLRQSALAGRHLLHGLRLSAPGRCRGRGRGAVAQHLSQPGLRRRQSAGRTQLPAMQHRLADRAGNHVTWPISDRKTPCDGRIRRRLSRHRYQTRQPDRRRQGHDLRRPDRVRHSSQLLPPRGGNPALA